MGKINNEEFLSKQKERINVKKGEVTFVSKEDLEKMGIKLFDSKKNGKEE